MLDGRRVPRGPESPLATNRLGDENEVGIFHRLERLRDEPLAGAGRGEAPRPRQGEESHGPKVEPEAPPGLDRFLRPRHGLLDLPPRAVPPHEPEVGKHERRERSDLPGEVGGGAQTFRRKSRQQLRVTDLDEGLEPRRHQAALPGDLRPLPEDLRRLLKPSAREVTVPDDHQGRAAHLRVAPVPLERQDSASDLQGPIQVSLPKRHEPPQGRDGRSVGAGLLGAHDQLLRLREVPHAGGVSGHSGQPVRAVPAALGDEAIELQRLLEPPEVTGHRGEHVAGLVGDAGVPRPRALWRAASAETSACARARHRASAIRSRAASSRSPASAR